MNYLFEENQKFTQWWLWVILLLFLIMLVGPFNENNIYHILIGLALPIFFYLFELRVKVNEEGLHYQFFPFHLKLHTIIAEEIEKIKAVKYKPLGDYGGWGIRYGFKGKAYNVTGNLGVKVHLTNGRNILFGSQRHIELEKALRKVRKQ